MPLERPLLTFAKFHVYKYQIVEKFVSRFHRLIKSLSFKGKTYPKVASASAPPVRENGRRLLQHQSSGRKTRKASWLKLRLCTENAAGGERQPEKVSIP
jgi:hypothetical protein